MGNKWHKIEFLTWYRQKKLLKSNFKIQKNYNFVVPAVFFIQSIVFSVITTTNP